MKQLTIFICLPLLLFACNNSPQSSPDSSEAEETVKSFFTDDTIISELVADTLMGEDVSHECAIMAYHLDELEDELDNVISPSMLMVFRHRYPTLLKDATEGMESLNQHDQKALRERIAEIKDKYIETGREYEVEPSGVIAQLDKMTLRLSKVKSAQDFSQFESIYLSNLRNLDIIHLSANQDSPDIAKLRSKAAKLKSQYLAAKHRYGRG